MKILSLFDASNAIRNEFKAHGCEALSLDISRGYAGNKPDIITDILFFKHTEFAPGYFQFLYIALPCTTYSIASGAHHFKNNMPLTSEAINAVNILIKVWQITKYFNCPFIIENPAGGLCNNVFFKQFFKLDISRISLGAFGYPTQKKTDLFSNFNLLLLNCPIHRVNGKYNQQTISNMSYRQRVTYPGYFTQNLVQSILQQI